MGAGTGLVFPAASVTTMSDIAEHRAGLASGLMTGAHEMGAALGVAVFSAVATAQAAAGFAVGYRRGFTVAARTAAGLAFLALLAIPAVRPRWLPGWRCTEMAAPRDAEHQRAIAKRNVDAILDAVEELLEQRVQATISAVAKHAGVSRVTVYSHFPTWEALLEAAIARAVHRTMTALQAISPDDGPPAGHWSGCSPRPGGTWPATARWPRPSPSG